MTSSNVTAPPPRKQTIGFALDLETGDGGAGRVRGGGNYTATGYGGAGDRTLLRTDTGRISIAASTRSIGGTPTGIGLGRTNSLAIQRIEARTALPIDFRTVSIQINDGKEADRRGAVKGKHLYCTYCIACTYS